MSKAKSPRVFVPLTKVDEEQQLVYGRITQEMLDKSQEVMDYDTSKPLFEKWSNDISEASGGLSKGNVRVMHGLTAAGKLTELDFDDGDKAIDVCAKIVDAAEWEKVTEGVYTGFSVGGKYEKRWTDTDDDGNKVKKFTANPNEVSIVDNPCVPSASFTMFKADGAEEEVEFQVDHDEDLWPGFTKAVVEETDEDKPKGKKKAKTQSKKKAADKKAEDKKAEKAAPSSLPIPNDVLVAKAEELAKAAGGDGTEWADHLDAARAELTKDAPNGEAQKETEEGGDAKTDTKEGGKADEEKESDEAAEGAEDPETHKAEKVTPPGVKQQWTASDGKAFDKKADAETHEETLAKADQSDADKLRERMEKAMSSPATTEELSVFEDAQRLGDVVQVLATPHENGEPVLNKGMYGTSTFARCLWDMSAITRKVYQEYKKEDGDEEDQAVFEAMKGAVDDFSKAFLAYASDQVTEMLAELEDGYCVDYYDYYCAAAKEDGDNQLAKDVCTVIADRRDKSRDLRDDFAKLYVAEAEVPEIDEDDLPPNLAKRFEAIEKDRDTFQKLAEDAISGIEDLKKSVADIGDTPAPRAPRNVIAHGNDAFFKGAESEEDKRDMLRKFIEDNGSEGAALALIKSAQQNGKQLTLNR